MSNPFLKKYPQELAEKLFEILEEVRERAQNPDFDFMEVEEIFFDFGLEPDYIIDIVNQIV